MSSRISLAERVTHRLCELCGIVGYLVAYSLGYGGRHPWWCTAVICAGILLNQSRFRNWLDAGTPHGRPGLRMTLVMAAGTASIYLAGWGPALVGILGVVVTMHIQADKDPALWRRGLVGCVVFTVLGQAAVAAGLADSYLAHPLDDVVAACVLGVSLLMVGTIGVASEERARAEAATAARERRFSALVRDSADVIAVLDSDRTVEYVSPAIRQLIGHEPEDLLGRSLRPWVHPEDVADMIDVFTEMATQADSMHWAELRFRWPDGTYRWAEVTVRNLFGDPDVNGYVVNVRDIHEQKVSEERLAYAADHDALTGLANRAAFGRALDAACALGEAAVLFVDLDGFKQINDVHGHEAGDALLVATAELLRAAAPPGATAGRFGGDEFGLVLGGPAADAAVGVAEKIIDAMREPVVFCGHALQLRASIGVATTLNAAGGAGELLRRADLAMYQEKRAATHRYQVAAPTPVPA